MLNLRRTIYKRIDLGDKVKIINEYLPRYNNDGILTAICMSDDDNPFIVLFYKDINDSSTCLGSQRCRFEDMKKL